MAGGRISEFRVYRFQFPRDRVVGDSQVRTSEANLVALELQDEAGRVGLGVMQVLFQSTPAEVDIARIFAAEAFPQIEGRDASALALQVIRRRGGNVRSMQLPFEEAIQHAVWDLFAKAMDLPLWQMLGAQRTTCPVYASGLDFHLSDHEFSELFAAAAEAGYRGYKIKVGHPDVQRDLHRLNLLRTAVGHDGRPVMIDANEAWTAAQAQAALALFAKAGHEIYWVEDPLPRDDFDGLRQLRLACPGVRINSGEYLDLSGKRKLLEAKACDMVNVHGQISDVMRAGWLANEHNTEVTFGNSILEIGVNMALALPDVRWLEYSFQNFEHLVETPFSIRNGLIEGSLAPGHGLTLSADARHVHRRAVPTVASEMANAPRVRGP